MEETRGTPGKRVRKLVRLGREIAETPGPTAELADRARELYRQLDGEERSVLFRLLVDELETPPARVIDEIQGARTASEGDPTTWARAVTDLRRDLESPRQRVLERLADAHEGLQTLMGLRADVLEAQRDGVDGLDPLELEIADLLNGWFRRGFLTLREIDRSSPYELIQYLKNHELVHPMVSLDEMGRRLGADRRCFGLFHCAMPSAPVVFIEIALSGGLVRSIHEIIEPGGAADVAERHPDTAVFYSINNTQDGLAGLGLGKVIILQVTETLQRDVPSLHTFATLSPIPGFWRRYLRPILTGDATRFELGREDVESMFDRRSADTVLKRHEAVSGKRASGLSEALRDVLDRADWIEDAELVDVLRGRLTDLAYQYIVRETDARGRPLNPVANFHLANGATVAKRNVSFGANCTKRGLRSSCGLMVNYVYSTPWLQKVRSTLGALLSRSG